MIMKIQLRQVLRNKRFLIFTIFVPVIWYSSKRSFIFVLLDKVKTS